MFSFSFYAYCSSVSFTFLVRDPRLLIVLKPESRRGPHALRGKNLLGIEMVFMNFYTFVHLNSMCRLSFLTI